MANLVKEEDLKEGQQRLLSTDNPVVVPVDTVIRVQTAAADVLHAFAVPALGVKIDANPGQLNETWFKATKTGTYYGQCSEICGAGHGFMPIEIKVVPKEEFAAWVKAQGGHMPGEEPVAAETKAADPKADIRTHSKPAGEK
jgi:cytochrome c oxidase subunit 2